MAGVKDVAALVAEAVGASKVVAEDYVKAVTDAISELAKTEAVIIRGFGTFKMKTTPACMRVNPQKPTEKISVPEKTKLVFKTTSGGK